MSKTNRGWPKDQYSRSNYDGGGTGKAQIITDMRNMRLITGILMRRMRGKKAILDEKEEKITTGFNVVTGKSDNGTWHRHKDIIRMGDPRSSPIEYGGARYRYVK